MKLVETLRSDDVGRSDHICSDKQAWGDTFARVSANNMPMLWTRSFWGANSRTLRTAIATKAAVKDLYAQS